MATNAIGAVLVIDPALHGRIERALRVNRTYTTIVTFDGPRRMLAVAFFAGTILFAAILQSTGHGVTGGRRIRVHSTVPLNIPAAAISRHFERMRTADASKIMASLAQEGILTGSSWSLFWEYLKSCSTARRDLEELERKVKATDEPQDTQAKEVYRLERDALGLASELSGLDRRSILAKIPSTLPDEPNPAVLKFAQKAAIEDAYISYDVTKFPGLDCLRESPSGVATFTNKTGEQLHVVNVNRTRRETTTGVDLIYLADSFESAIFVQYKLFNINNDPRVKSPKAAYRLVDRDKDQCKKMLAVQSVLHARGDRMDVRDYRLGPECVFYKLCHRCEPDTPSDLVPGIYFSVEHWRRLLEDPRTASPRGAEVIGYETSDRYLSNTEFVALVRGGWIGARDTAVERLEHIIESLLEDNRSVTIARKSRRAPNVSSELFNVIDAGGTEEFQLRVPDPDSGRNSGRKRKKP
ncbi:hypothetical protein [Nannocystis pusilla]|uniref:Uncharacterized protein n=1 Tax=Nannocystis pusilla TaxID=889268 RepID=A0ABS7U2X1_9BACT|nr:hypothetical protein [Nannocystis pusilla]MBZ5714885.1 hypothetical protein [Nannocystis pusilla]